MVAELNDEKLRSLAEFAQDDLRAAALRDMPKWRREIWNAAIEAAALIVEPVPHVDEERTCGEVAAEIRKLKMADASGVQASGDQTVSPPHADGGQQHG